MPNTEDNRRIVERYRDALARGAYGAAHPLLSEECVHKRGDRVLLGPDAILAAHRAWLADLERECDRVVRHSVVLDEEPPHVFVIEHRFERTRSGRSDVHAERHRVSVSPSGRINRILERTAP